MNEKIQVKKEHYKFENYFDINRWNSLYYQINEILKINPISILEIGAGNPILKNIILNINNNITYKTIDIDKNLNPNYIGSIHNFKINEKFDTVIAFQVLEHLPYNLFKISLENLKRHSNKYVIISLPYYGIITQFKFKLGNIINIHFIKKISLYQKIRKFKQHYWEINRPNYKLKKIKKDIKKHFYIKKCFQCKENPYHYFFILKIKK